MFFHRPKPLSTTNEGASVTAQRGVSFLEVAMVLIVTSLLAVSVLVGRDLYEAAKLRNLLSQLRQLDNAVSAFTEQYGFLPGDMPQAGNFGLQVAGTDCSVPTNGLGCGGNGNRLLEDSTKQAQKFDMELADFWIHLTNAEYSTSHFNGQNVLGQGFPETALERMGGIHVYGMSDTLSNYYHVGGVTPPSGDVRALRFENILTPKEAFNMDQKLDDTLPDEGLVRAYSSPEASGDVSKGKSGDDKACLNAEDGQLAYNTKIITRQCQVRIRFGT